MQVHSRIFTKPEEIIATLTELNENLHSTGVSFQWDEKDANGEYISYKANEVPADALIVLGSFDFSYYHQVEVVFYGTKAHTLHTGAHWPDHWSKPQLELLQGSEANTTALKLGWQLNGDEQLFAFNVGSHGDERYYILARGLSWYIGTVFHYDREAQDELKPGERVAYWVSKAERKV